MQVILFSAGMGASFTLTLLVALVLPVMFYANYVFNMNVPTLQRDRLISVEKSFVDELQTAHSIALDAPEAREGEGYDGIVVNPVHPHSTSPGTIRSKSRISEQREGDLSTATATMPMKERLANTLALWPYMVPLFLVYFAEYAMQSGVWAAMGFPITSENARNDFYQYSNWMYQAGVLVSRSSGTVWKAGMTALWVMPLLQCALLAFFIIDAYFKLWYDWSILTLCFVVGLFGGAVSLSHLVLHTINLSYKSILIDIK